MAGRTFKDHIPNDVLREAFLRSGLSANEVAIRMGREKGSGRGDASGVQVALGLRPYTDRNGAHRLRKSMNEETALAIARALHLDPFEIGL